MKKDNLKTAYDYDGVVSELQKISKVHLINSVWIQNKVLLLFYCLR